VQKWRGFEGSNRGYFKTFLLVLLNKRKHFKIFIVLLLASKYEIKGIFGFERIQKIEVKYS